MFLVKCYSIFLAVYTSTVVLPEVLTCLRLAGQWFFYLVYVE